MSLNGPSIFYIQLTVLDRFVANFNFLLFIETALSEIGLQTHNNVSGFSSENLQRILDEMLPLMFASFRIRI